MKLLSFIIPVGYLLILSFTVFLTVVFTIWDYSHARLFRFCNISIFAGFSLLSLYAVATGMTFSLLTVLYSICLVAIFGFVGSVYTNQFFLKKLHIEFNSKVFIYSLLLSFCCISFAMNTFPFSVGLLMSSVLYLVGGGSFVYVFSALNYPEISINLKNHF